MITGMLDTGPSLWSPIAMLGAVAVILFVVLLFRAYGRKGFKYSKEKAMPFYSGNVVPESARVRASDYFWGFFEAFKGYYSSMKGIHSGIINDYIFWFVVIASAVLVLLTFGVVQWA